jgi:hypothetical protein
MLLITIVLLTAREDDPKSIGSTNGNGSDEYVGPTEAADSVYCTATGKPLVVSTSALLCMAVLGGGV